MHQRTIGPLTTLGAALLVISSGCAPSEEVPAETAAATSEPSVSIAVLDCGELTLADPAPFNLTVEEAGTLEMFVPCYLIEHPKGRLLWDLGLPTTVRDGSFEWPGGALTLERTVLEQLADEGLDASDIDYVAMSHLHFDHCGQANDFASAHQLIQRAEHEAAFSGEVFPAFDPTLFDELESSETTVLDGAHDVFGDGTVVIHPAPGHTPGHQVLFVDLEETGPIVLSGDLYHFPANRELKRAPVFNYDAEQTFESMATVDALLEETGATLWIEHDAKLAATLDLWPHFYR